MKKQLLNLMLLTASIVVIQSATAQTCDGQRYYSKIFTGSTVSTVTYTDVNVTTQAMDIYQPTGDAATNRKAVLLIHGGSFYAGSKTDAFIVYMCQELAKRGYVTASINYRLVPFTSLLDLYDSTSAYPHVLQSMGDAKAAVRYLKKNATSLNIDSNWIVIGGESAGAIIGNHVAYVKTLAECSPLLRSDFAGIGGLEGNSGNPGYSTKVKAVLNWAGSLLSLGMITADDHEPLYSAHGDHDNTVPYLCGQVLGGQSNITTCGSGAMKPAFDALSIPNQLHTFQGADHVPWETSATDKDTVEKETALFLYKLDCPAFTNINDIANDVAVSLYPNPASKQITIKTDATVETIQVIDNIGRVVLNHTATGMQSHIDIAALSGGIYVAKIMLKDNKGMAMKSFVVE